ncbi:LAFE_0D09516g1_1 [Lachancea fermentati]|uniref:LAFE_0D09516g1_1 n=1 Tax=Lachancea fermentati TaxID=4955 RepID=A0A1G4MC02_LACFM|nr:LAFE_0D09516g1_1 [Lachancea fermentati]
MDQNGEDQNQFVSNGAPAVMAKEFTLDIPRIPSVELPLKVSASPSSVQKAVRMVGGLHNVKRALSSHSDTQEGLELYMNYGKEDNGSEVFFNEHPVIGRQVPLRDESIIVKISLPKGTLAAHNGDVRKSIASVPYKHAKIVPVAIIDNTIRFREMSDFQMCLDNAPAAKEFKESFGSMDWSKFKTYVESIPDDDSRPYENINNIIVDRSLKSPNTDFQLPPPPRFSMVNIPFVYKYKGNPYATKTSTGESTVKGTYLKNYQQFIHSFGESTQIPNAAHPSLIEDYEAAKKTGIYPGSNKESQFFEKLEKCLEILRKLFEKRPVWVKRHIDGIIPQDLHSALKIALSLVSYRFTKGPWRNTYIKLGIDPRSSSEYAKYQTEYFKIENKLLKSPQAAKNIPEPPSRFYQSNVPGEIDTRFVFDGKQIPWYLMLQIDLLIKEPNIAEIYDKLTYLEKPTELTGWYHELDLAKIRRIVKYELGCMVQGNYEFSEYKLKFFKNMLYAKESMMLKERDKEDEDGDVNMEDVENQNKEGDSAGIDDEEDNGVETGEIDDSILEAEEADDEESFLIEEDTTQSRATKDTPSNASEIESDNFDIKSASFMEIIQRIAKNDPETAETLRKELDGFVDQSQL